MKNPTDNPPSSSPRFHRRPQRFANPDFPSLNRKIRRSTLLSSISMVGILLIILVVGKKLQDQQLLEDQRVWLGLLLAFGVLVVFFIWKIPKWQLAAWKDRLEAKDLISLEITARTTLIQMLGGIALLGGLYFTKENLETTRNNAIATVALTQEGQNTERLNKAIEQLGNQKLEARLSGIFALAQIAAQSDRDYWPIIEVLTSFVRENSPLQTAEDGLDANPPKPVPSDIQAILKVLGTRRIVDKKGNSLEGKNSLDLHSTNLRGANLAGGNLEKANLAGAFLNEAKLQEANLKGASLSGAVLEIAQLQGASLESAVCEGARFNYADLSNSRLKGANLAGAVLDNAVFNDADLTEADLTSSYLNGTSFRRANLIDVVGLSQEWVDKANTDHLIDGATLPQPLTSVSVRHENERRLPKSLPQGRVVLFWSPIPEVRKFSEQNLRAQC